MNTQNFASLEASKRLVEAGIVLETEKVWFFSTTGWELVDRYDKHKVNKHYLPAPSMAEVWRELPNTLSNDTYVRLKTLMSYQAGYKALKDDVGVWFSYDTNPTDALIDLLIFVRKEKP
ncbi:MAG: hypothetical protein WC401_09245 [Bacteroidales bacterium]